MTPGTKHTKTQSETRRELRRNDGKIPTHSTNVAPASRLFTIHHPFTTSATAKIGKPGPDREHLLAVAGDMPWDIMRGPVTEA